MQGRGFCFFFCFVLCFAPIAWLLVAWIWGHPGPSAPGEHPEWTDSVNSQLQLSDHLTIGLLTRILHTLDLMSPWWRAPSQHPNSSFTSTYTINSFFRDPSYSGAADSQCPRSICVLTHQLLRPQGKPTWRATSQSPVGCNHTFSNKVHILALGKGPPPNLLLPWVLSLSPRIL